MTRPVFCLSLILFLFFPAQSKEKIGLPSIDGKSNLLDSIKGKPTLVVNIATRCGYTGQLDGLEKLYKKYKDKGLMVVGIPSNDFGGQTPESEKGVKKFCRLKYGVTFPLSKKTVVKGNEKHPYIRKLIRSSKDKKEISWNFEKFLIDKNGKVVGRFGSSTKPMSQILSESIEKVL